MLCRQLPPCSEVVKDADILLAIIDGMDRSKYALPRWLNSRTPKGADKKNRPSLDLYACILHGRAVNIFITDENQTVGANFAAEIWARSVQKAWEACQHQNKPFPSHAILFGDNTSRELRNSCFSKLFCAITSGGRFTSASVKHLPVGHTHEDIGAGLTSCVCVCCPAMQSCGE